MSLILGFLRYALNNTVTVLQTDIHVMSPSGEWSLMGTEVTDGHGRLHFTIPRDKQLSLGIHPVKMVVRYVYNLYLCKHFGRYPNKMFFI